MQEVSCGVVTVIIGREFALHPLLNYFKNVEIPNGVNASLYLVLGCDSDFEILLKNKVKDLELETKYSNIHYIPGNLKCHPNLDWKEWEQFTRKEDPDEKHRAALYNIEIGLMAAKNETYVHFVDDDTIPPSNALKDLLKSYQNIDGCGLASGIYFNKVWVEPTVAVGSVEATRRIVGSYKKHTWLGCSIDDLAIENYQDIGFVGNGCMLISGEDAANITPLSEWRNESDDIAPPDFIICRRIRELNGQGKKISIVPSVVAEHLDQSGKQVGLSREYLEKIKNSEGIHNFLVIQYDKYLNYHKLSQQFDTIIIIHTSEIHQEIPKYLHDFNNIQIIKKSIKDTCETFNNDKEYNHFTGKISKYYILAQMYEFIQDKFNYVAHYYDAHSNTIRRPPPLDSRNLKKLLNQKP